VIELLKANVSNHVVLRSDVVWDQFIQIDNGIKLQISGGPSTLYSIEFTDAVNHPTLKAGVQVEDYSTLIFLYCRVMIAGDREKAIFSAHIGKWKVRSYTADFIRNQSAYGYLFSNIYAGELDVYLQGGSIENLEGYLFEGVPAGTDPNERNLVYCNLING